MLVAEQTLLRQSPILVTRGVSWLTDIPVESETQLARLLVSYGVDMTQSTKSIADLWQEVVRTEAVFKDCNGVLERRIHTQILTILSPDGNKRLAISSKEFHDGRPSEHYTGIFDISEKYRAGESNFKVAARAISEELLANSNFDRAHFSIVSLVNHEPRKPAINHNGGLRTVNLITRFAVRLHDQLYNPHGYSEQRPDGVVYTKWLAVRS
jgi:hypothetical protein